MTNKNDGMIALIMIIALIAFVIGSAIGISVSIDEHENTTNNVSNDSGYIENVTVEMTSNLNDSNNKVYYDQKEDNLDFNDNDTLKSLNKSN